MKQQPITLALAPDATLTLHASAPPIEVRSSFQHISVEHTASFGQLYRLDGDAMAAEADEFMIHESLAHLAALEHPSPRRAIILGGGDGASARELLKHPSLTRIVVAELDPLVVSTLREHIRSLSTGAFDDRRVELCIGDAARSLKALHDQGEAFDLILFDLTETDDPACAHVQLGSPFYQPDKVRNLCQRLRRSFANVRLSLIHAPLYGGPWLLARCRTQPTPGPDANLLQQRLEERGIRGLRYYNPALHLASEALPNHLRDLLA